MDRDADQPRPESHRDRRHRRHPRRLKRRHSSPRSRPTPLPVAERQRILFPFLAEALSADALDGALRLAAAEHATLVPACLARVPHTPPPSSPPATRRHLPSDSKKPSSSAPARSAFPSMPGSNAATRDRVAAIYTLIARAPRNVSGARSIEPRDLAATTKHRRSRRRLSRLPLPDSSSHETTLSRCSLVVGLCDERGPRLGAARPVPDVALADRRGARGAVSRDL